MVGVATYAQRVDFYGGVGYATYTYKELREYQQLQERAAGIGSSAVAEFPPFFTYSFGGNVNFKKLVYGFEVGHGSTGGRVAYEDYSGKLIQDIKVNYNYAGVSAAIFLFKRDDMEVLGGIKALFLRNKLTLDNSLTLESQSPVTEHIDFYGPAIGVRPNVTFRKFFGPLMLSLAAGYEIQTNSYPQTKGENRLFLDNGSNEPVHLQGNGLRLNFGVGVRFGEADL